MSAADPTPPTPRAVLIQKAWMRQHDALQAFIGHPGVPWEPVKQAQQDIETAIRADERAALAASVGPLAAEQVTEWARLRERIESELSPSAKRCLNEWIGGLDTAYTALAAECAGLRVNLTAAQNEASGFYNDCLVKDEAHERILTQYKNDLAALRATVGFTTAEIAHYLTRYHGWSGSYAMDDEVLHELEAHLSESRKRLARTPTPEGQG